VAISSVIATFIGRQFFTALPSFHVPALSLASAPGSEIWMVVSVVVFGLLLGVLAWMLTRGIYWFEDLFDAMPGDYYSRHISGMLIVGCVIYGFMTLSTRVFGQPDHYYVEGVGYATIMDILRGDLTAPGFLVLLVGAKLLVTCLTLGSGASGGVFSPAMFLGATFGGVFGAVAQGIIPGLPLSPSHFAYAGMAGMVGGTTGAVLTGIVMVFEMTRDYTVILPVILTVALACAVRDALSAQTIYTLKLVRRGETVPQGLYARMTGYTSRDVMSADFVLFMHQSGCEPIMAHEALRQGCRVVTLASGGEIHCMDTQTLAETLRSSVVVDVDAPLNSVLRALDEAKASFAVVTRRTSAGSCEVAGVITA
jgi:CIC family chloride channel protein